MSRPLPRSHEHVEQVVGQPHGGCRPAPWCAHSAFTLVEAVVAASLLVLTVTCVTPLIVASQRAAARESRGAMARRLAESALERLRGLPFAPSGMLQADSPTELEACAAGALFPHADESRNRPDKFVVLADGGPWPAGTFITRRREGSYVLTTESYFATVTSTGIVSVPMARLAGYDVSTSVELPSCVLVVTVEVSWTERGGDSSLTRHETLLDESMGQSTVATASSP